MKIIYIVSHDWDFGDLGSGHEEKAFESYEEAFERFEAISLLISADEYPFEAVRPAFNPSSDFYSVFEKPYGKTNTNSVSIYPVSI